MAETVRLDWSNLLRSRKQRLILAQVVTGVVILGVDFPRPIYRHSSSVADFFLFFVALTATLLSVVRLVDELQLDHPIRKVFGAALWFQSELRFTGLAAVILHCSAWAVLLATIGYVWYPALSIIGIIFGWAASILYLINWWWLFRERHVVRGDNGEETVETADNVEEGKYLAVNLASVPLVGQIGQPEKEAKFPRTVEPNNYI
ncbi:uncharacterized protein LOC129718149 [Wyeomyia smithii]|uniref:uncharacterized protein LOC129718149 n=1 Tax=Wyeomyia smithii TaxID=174621 RepID=UPI0024681346|nr:uncharacterized protein LOC129718149 [Wyeomyia smithii]